MSPSTDLTFFFYLFDRLNWTMNSKVSELDLCICTWILFFYYLTGWIASLTARSSAPGLLSHPTLWLLLIISSWLWPKKNQSSTFLLHISQTSVQFSLIKCLFIWIILLLLYYSKMVTCPKYLYNLYLIKMPKFIRHCNIMLYAAALIKAKHAIICVTIEWQWKRMCLLSVIC